jgi:hypothetical protein
MQQNINKEYALVQYHHDAKHLESSTPGYTKMKPDFFKMQFRTSLITYYEDINGVQGARGCPKTKIVKRKFEDQEDDGTTRTRTPATRPQQQQLQPPRLQRAQQRLLPTQAGWLLPPPCCGEASVGMRGRDLVSQHGGDGLCMAMARVFGMKKTIDGLCLHGGACVTFGESVGMWPECFAHAAAEGPPGPTWNIINATRLSDLEHAPPRRSTGAKPSYVRFSCEPDGRRGPRVRRSSGPARADAATSKRRTMMTIALS